MIFDTLICLLDEHNEINILLAKKFKVKNVVLLVTDYNKESKSIYSQMLPSCSIELVQVEKGNFEGIKKVICKYKKPLVNLNGGDRLNSLILLRSAGELGIKSIYLDLANKRRYIFTEDFKMVNEHLMDMTIEEIINLTGVSIIDESSYLIEKREILDITKIIQDNIDIWHKYKQKLYDNNTFQHDYKEPYKLIINRKSLVDEELYLIENALTYLRGINGIEYCNKSEEILINFKNDYLKGFLFKSGTWLEVLTHLVISQIDEIDETKSGVVFSWSNNAKEVRNELDVIAVKDSILICVSCKDSEKYNEDALNELEVYSERLGGEDSIKILVATKKPYKATVNDRAREMGINLVILDKDINMFKDKIRDIIINKD